MIITNALDMFNSLFDKKLESNYLWNFKSFIQNRTIASTLQAVVKYTKYGYSTETNIHYTHAGKFYRVLVTLHAGKYCLKHLK